ncbi:hypothetical protein [Streptomyces sp. NPDC059979]
MTFQEHTMAGPSPNEGITTVDHLLHTVNHLLKQLLTTDNSDD